jgi:hypothetical protein
MEALGGLEKDKGPHKKEEKKEAIPALNTPSPKLWKFDILTSCNSSHNSPNAHYYYYYVYKTSDNMPAGRRPKKTPYVLTDCASRGSSHN